MEKAYSITLSNGIIINNLQINGNIFITDEYIDPQVFGKVFTKIKVDTPNIDGDEYEMFIYENAYLYLVSNTEDEGTWFALATKTKEELQQAKLRSDIDYIAMISDIEL